MFLVGTCKISITLTYIINLERGIWLNIFAKRLKKCREDKKRNNPNFTQGFVADKVGVARTTYTAYENGTKTPPLETVNIIADLFEVTTDYLLGRTDFPDYSQTQQQEFERFKDNPELQRFFYELPKSPEEDLKALKVMWDFIQSQKK